MSSCPECNSTLYGRTPKGWRCSMCNYAEPLQDEDVLVNTKPGQAHGNVWGEQRNLGRGNGYVTPKSTSKEGSLKTFQDIRERNVLAALHYLLEHHFTGKADLNRHYLAAKLCFELRRLEQAKNHIDICIGGLAQAANPESVRALEERIDAARRAHFRRSR